MMFSYSDECRTKKAFKYVKIMLPLFLAVEKYCSAILLCEMPNVQGSGIEPPPILLLTFCPSLLIHSFFHSFQMFIHFKCLKRVSLQQSLICKGPSVYNKI